MIKCKKCGTEISDKSIECVKCGELIEKGSVSICPECGKEIKGNKCMNCGYEEKVEVQILENVVNNGNGSNISPNTGGSGIFIGSIVMFVIMFFIVSWITSGGFASGGNGSDNGMSKGCYRALNKNGGLSDFELCLYSDSVVYNYLELDKALNSHERTEKLYPDWLSDTKIQIKDNYDQYWFTCDIDRENGGSMKCRGFGNGGFGIGSLSTWKKQ